MRWFLTILAVLMIAASVVGGVMGHRVVVIGEIVGALAVLAFANLDRIDKFKASSTGIEVEMRKLVEQAKGTIAELQALGVLVATLSLSFVKRQGRRGPYTDEQQDAIREDITRVLVKLGVPDGQIQDALFEWHQWVEFDYVHAILGGNAIPQTLGAAVQDQRRALLERGITNPLTPEGLRTFLVSHQVLTPEREAYIEDYAYYRAHRKHRRPDAWRLRGNLGQLIVQPGPVQSRHDA